MDMSECNRLMKAWSLTTYLIEVSLDPMARWTFKVSHTGVSISHNKCERSYNTDCCDNSHRQQKQTWFPIRSHEEPLKFFKHF